MGKKVYVASSWRNDLQPQVVAALRAKGYEVYDFKNPEPGNHGSHWSEIDPNWKDWTPQQFIQALYHPIAIDGFNRDMDALNGCDICVLVLPCGRSAHLELGHTVGAGKHTFILNTDPEEPELMYRMVNAVCTSVEELLDVMELQTGTASEEELKPCPFCGSPAEVTDECDIVWIKCSNEDCRAERIFKFDEPEDAIEDWNKRA